MHSDPMVFLDAHEGSSGAALGASLLDRSGAPLFGDRQGEVHIGIGISQVGVRGHPYAHASALTTGEVRCLIPYLAT
jgi:hypothetical protein